MNLKDVKREELLGRGTSAKCYALDKNLVFKQYNQPRSIDDINRFKYFLEYKHASFAFPFDFVYDNKKFYGYISKRIFAPTFDIAFPKSKILDLSTSVIKLEDGIKCISKGKINMYDFHSENILYDGKTLTVIDPDDYGIDYIHDTNYVYNQNMHFYKTTIFDSFKENIICNKNTRYIVDLIDKYKYSNISVGEAIVNIKFKMDKYYKEEINTMEDFKKMIGNR